MSQQIETDIFNFMSANSSASSCLENFLPFWRARGLSSSDVHIISHFLYNNGAYTELLNFSIENLQRDEPLSWYYLSKTLILLEPNLQAVLYETLRNYLTDSRKLDEFISSELFDVLFPEEKELKLHQIQQKIQIKERHRQTLLDQIRVFNQSRNYTIEKQTIQKFIKFFPNDRLGQELLQRFETEELQRFFQRYKNEQQSAPSSHVEAFTEEEKSILHAYFEQIQLTIHSNRWSRTENASSYIYFFLFLEDYVHALQLLPFMPNSVSRDWLQLDLLVLNRKFAEALSYIKELEAHFQNEPEFYTAKVYYLAQCFWGLGDRRKAIELMENLIQIKPDYRIASSLLKDWRMEL